MGGRGAGAGGQGPGTASRFEREVGGNLRNADAMDKIVGNAVESATEGAEDAIYAALLSAESAGIAGTGENSQEIKGYLQGVISKAVRDHADNIDAKIGQLAGDPKMFKGNELTKAGRDAVRAETEKVFDREMKKFNSFFTATQKQTRSAIDKIYGKPATKQNINNRNRIAQLVAAGRAQQTYSQTGVESKVTDFDAAKAIKDALDTLSKKG